MFSFNQTTRSQHKSTQHFKFPQTKVLPIQRREKIKDLLIIKFMKKYSLKDSEVNIEDEMNKFLNKEQISDHDLKNFDYHLSTLINERRSYDNLHKNLVLNSNIANSQEINNKYGIQTIERYPENNINDYNNDYNNDNKSVKSKKSIMSGISKLSLFSELNDEKIALKNQTYKKLRESIESDKVYDLNTLPIDIKGDNWAEINIYNNKLYEKEKIESKIKEKQIKLRIRETLDNQCKEKLVRKSMEYERNKIFDDITLKHADNLKNLEKERELEVKMKKLREKDSRDKQLEDEMRRKKLEAFKTRRYERDLGKLLLLLLLLYLIVFY